VAVHAKGAQHPEGRQAGCACRNSERTRGLHRLPVRAMAPGRRVNGAIHTEANAMAAALTGSGYHDRKLSKLLATMPELRGKDLLCWCAPKPATVTRCWNWRINEMKQLHRYPALCSITCAHSSLWPCAGIVMAGSALAVTRKGGRRVVVRGKGCRSGAPPRASRRRRCGVRGASSRAPERPWLSRWRIELASGSHQRGSRQH
jgi:hypothetical protein